MKPNFMYLKRETLEKYWSVFLKKIERFFSTKLLEKLLVEYRNVIQRDFVRAFLTEHQRKLSVVFVQEFSELFYVTFVYDLCFILQILFRQFLKSYHTSNSLFIFLITWFLAQVRSQVGKKLNFREKFDRFLKNSLKLEFPSHCFGK